MMLDLDDSWNECVVACMVECMDECLDERVNWSDGGTRGRVGDWAFVKECPLLVSTSNREAYIYCSFRPITLTYHYTKARIRRARLRRVPIGVAIGLIERVSRNG